MNKENPQSIENFDWWVKSGRHCPICGNLIIRMNGGGWDYDQVFCSNRKCEFALEFDTTTDAQSEKNHKERINDEETLGRYF